MTDCNKTHNTDFYKPDLMRLVRGRLLKLSVGSDPVFIEEHSEAADPTRRQNRQKILKKHMKKHKKSVVVFIEQHPEAADATQRKKTKKTQKKSSLVFIEEHPSLEHST